MKHFQNAGSVTESASEGFDLRHFVRNWEPAHENAGEKKAPEGAFKRL